MDKRVKKTRQQIYKAFAEVLKEKGYAKMTVEDILQESGVSRSTFYTHFKTKDDVLDSISANIFEHVFSHSLTVEETHDFSKSSIFDYSHLLTHIFYHLHDEKELITAILASSSRNAFLHDMRLHVMPIIDRLISDRLVKRIDVPEKLLKDKVCEDFILSVVYWFENSCAESPEKIKDYFFAMNT
ncbi:MAG: TetR/AcrR family transcriptional regulator [Clostridia bacterium]|nr:TetR/AcrR family transcriptional regulator [Clostridia bacterium]